MTDYTIGREEKIKKNTDKLESIVSNLFSSFLFILEKKEHTEKKTEI